MTSFTNEKIDRKLFCRNCGMEMEEFAEKCKYCNTPVEMSKETLEGVETTVSLWQEIAKALETERKVAIRKYEGKKSLIEAIKRRLGPADVLIKKIEVRESGVSLMMNTTRQKLYSYLCKKPCTHIREIAREFKIGLPTIQWHLNRLEAGGFVKTKKINNRLVYWPTGFLADEDCHIFELLNNPTMRKICSLILERPGIIQKDLCALFGMYQQKMLSHLKKLENAKIIMKRKEGKNRKYYITDRLEGVRKKCRELWEDYKKNLLELLKRDNVNPKVTKITENSITIQISTGRKKYGLKIDCV